MHYITHITLTTGHVAHQGREDVSDATLAVVVPWLRAALSSGQPEPIPAVPGGYAAVALQQDGALVVTVYGPSPDIGQRMPLATFGVAARSRHASMLWDMLMHTQPAVLPRLQQPGTPWCAVVPYPMLLDHPDAAEWLGDLERCIAWAWATCTPDVRPA